jgi:hypothetical protein
MTRSPALVETRDDTAALRFVADSLRISGAVAAVGVILLVAMFIGFVVGATGPAQAIGRMNDVAVLIAYLLCAPTVVATSRLLGPSGPTSSRLLLALGLGSIVAIVVLQALLVLEVLTFEEQIGPVAVALWALGAWFIATGIRGARAGVLPGGARMGVLAALYVGYPLWAFWLARILRAHAGGADR